MPVWPFHCGHLLQHARPLPIVSLICGRCLTALAKYLVPSRDCCRYRAGLPWDVIFGFPEAGIALFFVRHIWRDLPVDLSGRQREQDRPKPHQYRPVHDPEEDNYSHSVIAVLKDGQRVIKSADVGKKAKKEFKQIISDMSLVLRRPKAQTSA